MKNHIAASPSYQDRCRKSTASWARAGLQVCWRRASELQSRRGCSLCSLLAATGLIVVDAQPELSQKCLWQSVDNEVGFPVTMDVRWSAHGDARWDWEGPCSSLGADRGTLQCWPMANQLNGIGGRGVGLPLSRLPSKRERTFRQWQGRAVEKHFKVYRRKLE